MKTPLNSEVHQVLYSVQKMLDDLNKLGSSLRDAWPPPPAQSNAPREAKSKIAAQMFARDLGNAATVENAIALLQKERSLDAASFLDAATELLKAENPRAKVSFDMHTLQKTMELGHLCAFVDFRLSNMLRENQKL
jgi:hypothetical protein